MEKMGFYFRRTFFALIALYVRIVYIIYIKEKIPIRGGSDWAFLVYCYTLYRETLLPSPTHL